MEKTRQKKRRRVSLFAVVNGVFLTAIGLLCILPLIHIVAVSLSSGTMSSQNLVGLVPLEFTLESYAEALTDTAMVTAAGISLESGRGATILRGVGQVPVRKRKW